MIENLPELASFITQVGFPIALASYLVIRTERIILNNTLALGEIKATMEKCRKA